MAACSRSGVFALVWAVVACGARSPLDVPELEEEPAPVRIEDPKPREPEPEVSNKPPQVMDPKPMPTPEPEPTGSVRIGGCTMLCEGGCFHPGLVVGTRLDTGEQLIPVDISPEQYRTAPGYTCAVDLPRGLDLLLEARVEPGFRFVRWTDSVAMDLGWGPCPCTGSTDPTCVLTVDVSLYCGAVYRAR